MRICSIVILLGLSLLSAPDADGKKIVYGEPEHPQTYDPFTAQEVSVQHLSDLLFDALFIVGQGSNYKPQLASGYKIENNGRSVVVDLKSDIFWNFPEGSKHFKLTLNAQDVASTILALKNPKSKIPNGQRFNLFERVDIVSTYRLRITYSRALKDPLKPLLLKILPAVLVEGSLSKESVIATMPIGTGPYAVSKISPQGEVLLQRNEKYFGSKPEIKTIVMKPYADPTIMSQSLMFGGVDFSTKVTSQDLPEILADNRLGAVAYDNLSYSFLAFNHRKRIFSDKKFRLAMMHAIDREEILKAFYSDKGRRITGPFAPSSWAYNLEVNAVEFDIDRAKALLDELKILDTNGDSIREDANGDPLVLSFSIPLNSQGQMVKRIALALSGYFQAVGLKVKLVFMPWVNWKNKVIEEHEFDMTLASWSFDDASNIYSLFHSASSAKGGNNFVGFNSPLVDSLLQESEVTNDFDKKRMIYQKLHAILADEQAYGFLWNVDSHVGHNRKIKGIRVEPFGVFKHIQSWRVTD